MDLASLKTIKNLLSARGIRPSKGLGQNFLVDRSAVGKVIEAAELNSDETVMEIGPGMGVLTQELAKRTKKVIAVEKDQKMVEILEETLKDYKNVEIIRGDIRDLIPETDLTPDVFPLTSGVGAVLKVVGNLPFYLTAPVIRQLLERADSRCLYAVFVVQKEVAQRICAKVPDMNLLAVSVQFYAEPQIISYISKKSFWPSPEVDAAIIKITPLNPGFPKPRQTPDVNEETSGVKSVSEIDRNLFFKIVKAGFSQPRKQLANNLSKGLDMDKTKIGEWLLKNNIQPSQRAETLAINDWLGLTNSFTFLSPMPT